MKNLFRTTAIMCVLLLTAIGTFAQGQFDAIKKMGEGEYRQYIVEGQPGNYKFLYEQNSRIITLKFRNENDPRLFAAVISYPPQTSDNYTMDEVGYGVTMYRGDIKHPKLKYLKRPPNKDKDRLVAVGDYLYILHSYKSADDFVISMVLKKGTLSKIKRMKEEYKAMLTMKKENLEQQLKDYLKKETAAQAAALPKWKAANADYYAQIQKDEQTWKKIIHDSDWKRHEMEKKWLAEKGGSSSSSSSSSKSSGGGTVQMKVSAGSMGKVYVHWKDKGNSKKKVITSSLASTFSVPAGAKLYYSKDGSSQKFFMDAPSSGTGSYKF